MGAYEGARSTFEVVIGDPRLLEVATKMQDALRVILRARADYRAGAIPDAISSPAQRQEGEFRRLAHELSLSTAGVE
jgi:hypothetical protein